MRRLPARWPGVLALAAAVLATFAFVAGWDGLATGNDPVRSFVYSRHPSEPEDCGVLLTSEVGHLVGEERNQARLVLAVDDEWRARFGADAERQARAIVEEIAPLFDPFGIELDIVKVAHWSSRATPVAAHPLLVEAESSVALEEADAVLALTGHELRPADGVSVVGGRIALVGHHPGHPERDRLVAAHEIGHLFGAYDAVADAGDSSVMLRRGADHDLVWSACHERILRLNAARFQGAADFGN